MPGWTRLLRAGVAPCLATGWFGLLAWPASPQTLYGEWPLAIVDDLKEKLLVNGYRTSYAIGDFDHDGHNDLAVGIPYATVAGKRAAGKVVVWTGGPDGITDHYWTYTQAGVGRLKLPGANESGDLVGFSLTAGDFNGDGVTDLAVGAPGEDRPQNGIYSGEDAGAVFVGHGTRNGLSFVAPGTAYTQDGSGRYNLAGEARYGHLVGFSLAAGDFDGDGYCDLAIGVPGRFRPVAKGRWRDVGAVVVAEGARPGLDGRCGSQANSREEFWQGGSGCHDLAGDREQGDCVGFALAAGDLNGDGRDEIAIGAPGEGIGDLDNAGAVMLLKGTRDGPDARCAPEAYHASAEGMYDLRGSSEAGACLGFSLAIGDFNGDRFGDLAIGVPGRTVSGKADSGAVVVAVGREDGGYGQLRLDGRWYRHEFTMAASDDRYDLPGEPSWNGGELVGFSLAAGDFDFTAQYPRDDLAIGAPGADVSIYAYWNAPYWDQHLVSAAGCVFVRFGSGTGGLASAKEPRMLAQLGYQAPPEDNLYDTSETYDGVGTNLAAGYLGDDNVADLLISAPGERMTNYTLDVDLSEAYRLMFVDGWTHIVYGEAGVGPNAETEGYFWFNRFTRGLQVDPLYVHLSYTDLMTEAVDRLSGPAWFAGWNSVDLDLAGTGEDDVFALNASAVDYGNVDGVAWYSPMNRSVRASIYLGPDDEDIALSESLVSGVRGFRTPRQVILLPTRAVEAVLTP